MPWLELWAKIQVVSWIVAICIAGIAIIYHMVKVAVLLIKSRHK